MQFQYGDIVKTPPQGFIHRELWPEYKRETIPPSFCRVELVGTNPVGVRASIWPMSVESYTSDLEPDLAASNPNKTARNRIVIWKRLSDNKRPRGWFAASIKPSAVEGFAVLEQGVDYWKQWSESAKRYRKKWLTEYADRMYTLQEASCADFEQGYLGSPVARRTHNDSLNLIKKMHAARP
jgi:hypothetical protein